jgi:hypothetical protein
MHLERASWGGILLATSLILAGCAEEKAAEVRGTVQLDGKPLETGSIQFTALDGSVPTAGGGIKDGRYSVRVPLHKMTAMKVTLSSAKVVGTRKLFPDDPKSPEQKITAERLPAKYNEEGTLQLDVKPGLNEKNFDLKSD